MLPHLFIATLLACAANANAGLPEPAANLPEQVSSLLLAANIPQEAIGVIVLRGDQTLLAHRADVSMQPASTMKLVTSIVALEQLSPAFRARTELRTSADLIDGVLMGDLILRGGADPDFDDGALRRMLQTLRNQGIRKINGDLILDRQLFQPARLDLELPPFDESPESRYNVIPDALLLNTNLLHINVRSTTKKLTLTLMPPLDNVTLGADMTLGPGACSRSTDGWSTPDYVRAADGKIHITLHGSFPKNCIRTASVNLLDRNDYADRLFRASWRQLGGSFKGRVREARQINLHELGRFGAVGAVGAMGEIGLPLNSTRLLTEHMSRALPEVLRDINKSSDNTMARMLYLSLGSLSFDPVFGSRPLPMVANTALRSDMVVRQWLQQQGIADDGLVLDNGSGLSRTARIQATQMAALLQAASRSPWAPEFLASLPIVALDGTMRRRLGASVAASRARIKTGTLNNVVAIAGYVQDAHGQPCVVVAMINHDLAGSIGGRAVLDGVIDWVANTGR
jgi:D-alanyl-D-alanine carboxypeptidase/D-alanyl-D-alanine-endopeptidase (penicillin-binding protein 4)